MHRITSGRAKVSKHTEQNESIQLSVIINVISLCRRRSINPAWERLAILLSYNKRPHCLYYTAVPYETKALIQLQKNFLAYYIIEHGGKSRHDGIIPSRNIELNDLNILPSGTDGAESFNLEVSGNTRRGTMPLRPTSMDPAIEPIHGYHDESIYV